MSKLYFRYGAMNSGKSTALLQVAHNYEERGMNIVIVKPQIDSKIKNQIHSRLNISRNADILVSDNDNIIEEVKKFKNISCVLVDEAQFLTVKQIDELYEIAVLMHIPVICYGLRADFKNDGFPGSIRLLLLAHSLEELKTICMCGKKAVHNSRKINGKWVFEGEQVVIDNSSNVEYVSLCSECYFKKKNESKKKC